MLRIAICDDLPEQVEKIKDDTKQYFESRMEEIQLAVYNNPMEFLGKLEKKAYFDIILLDICMPGINEKANPPAMLGRME